MRCRMRSLRLVRVFLLTMNMLSGCQINFGFTCTSILALLVKSPSVSRFEPVFRQIWSLARH